jgi:hypothetical protein
MNKLILVLLLMTGCVYYPYSYYQYDQNVYGSLYSSPRYTTRESRDIVFRRPHGTDRTVAIVRRPDGTDDLQSPMFYWWEGNLHPAPSKLDQIREIEKERLRNLNDPRLPVPTVDDAIREMNAEKERRRLQAKKEAEENIKTKRWKE